MNTLSTFLSFPGDCAYLGADPDIWLSPADNEEDQAPASQSLAQSAPSLAGERKLTIALAEDNRGDVLLVEEALREHELDANLIVKRDGEEMFQYLEAIEAGELPCPDLLLLDLNLPRRTGIEVLAKIRTIEPCRQIPVIVVTSSSAQKDRDSVTRLGADGYFCKPSDYDAFMQLGGVVRSIIERGGADQ